MFSESQISKVIDTLLWDNCATVTMGGVQMRLILDNDSQTLRMVSEVFCGENYIPPSVRQSLDAAPHWASSFMHTSLRVDESAFMIFLEYQGPWVEESVELHQMFWEFAGLAEEWRDWLNEKGKGDLLPIYLKRS